MRLSSALGPCCVELATGWFTKSGTTASLELTEDAVALC